MGGAGFLVSFVRFLLSFCFYALGIFPRDLKIQRDGRLKSRFGTITRSNESDRKHELAFIKLVLLLCSVCKLFGIRVVGSIINYILVHIHGQHSAVWLDISYME